jgi:hypothetical protein
MLVLFVSDNRVSGYSPFQDQAGFIVELGDVAALENTVSSCQGSLRRNTAQQRTKSLRARAIIAVFLRVFCPPLIR